MDYLLFDNMAQCTETEVARLLPLVSAQRREQALRYAHTFGQFTCLKSYCLLTDLLRKHGLLRENEQPDFEYNEYGKPYLRSGVEFSVSHCKQAILVAIDRHPIGVDIEGIRTANEALIRRTMNENERAAIAAAERPDIAFTRLWTQKEAVVKQRGTGIISDLHTVLITPPQPHIETIEHIEPTESASQGYIYTFATHPNS